MRILFTIIIFQFIYSIDIHRGCMRDNGSRSYGSRPILAETYLSPSGHFLIHYDGPESDKAPDQVDTNPSNGIPDYVEEVALIADLTRSTLVDVMGFRPEVDDLDGKYDIYIVNLGSGFNAAYGWNYTDDDDGIEGTSWVEIDNDYIEDSYYTNGLDAMRVTVAHEFFHAIQRAYHEKSSGNYIEGGSQSISYSYFYEFSSMWLEDIIVPDGNDYLHFLSSSADQRRFFSNPEQKFSDTDGYSVALYGHYLSSIIENVEDQTLSTIIRRAWEKFSDELLDPIDALDSVLSDYNYTFIESWVDFCSRNFHNGYFPDMNNNIYYYSDQTSTVLGEYFTDEEIKNINLHQGYIHLDESLDTLSLLEDNNILNFELDDLSVEMHSIISDSMSLLYMDYSELPFLGKYIIAESEVSTSGNVQIEDVSSNSILLDDNEIIHFIYAGSDPSLVNVSMSVSYFPPVPELLSVSIVDEEIIELFWEIPIEENDITYNIYRNGILIDDQILETSYLDSTVNSNTEYEYSVSSSNLVGESELSNSIAIMSWPESNDIVNTEIVSLYPNPVLRPGISDFNIIVDYQADFSNIEISIYDIKGRLIGLKRMGPRDQGRKREELGKMLFSELSSGIYFIYIDFGGSILKQKFTILK